MRPRTGPMMSTDWHVGLIIMSFCAAVLTSACVWAAHACALGLMGGSLVGTVVFSLQGLLAFGASVAGALMSWRDFYYGFAWRGWGYPVPRG